MFPSTIHRCWTASWATRPDSTIVSHGNVSADPFRNRLVTRRLTRESRDRLPREGEPTHEGCLRTYWNLDDEPTPGRNRTAAESQAPPLAAKPPTIEELLALAKRGVRIFRCGVRTKEPGTSHGVKDATDDPELIRRWFTEMPGANYGVAAGINNFVIVDIDPRNGGAKSFEKLSGQIPWDTWDTVRVKTGGADEHLRRGMHFYYLAPPGVEVKGKAKAFGDEYPGIDLIAGNKYVVGPGSVHPSGRKYEWVAGAALTDREPKTFPKELLDIYAAAEGGATDDGSGKRPFAPAAKVKPGDRYDAVIRIAGQLTHFGYTKEAVQEAVYAQAVKTFDTKPGEPSVTSSVVREQIRQEAERVWDKYHAKAIHAPGTNGGPSQNGHAKDLGPVLPDGLRRSDTGNAARFARQYEEAVRWVKDQGKWIVLSNGYWPYEEEPAVIGLAKKTAANMFVLASQLDDPEEQKRIVAWALQSENASRLQAMVKLSKDLLSVESDVLDTHTLLLNVRNGTLDLKTGTLRPPDPTDYITKRVDIDYRPDAPRDLWEKFVDRIMNHDKDKTRFLQQMCGYALAGDIGEQCVFFLYGKGQNGKTVFLEVLRSVLGKYARNADITTFTEQRGDKVRSDLARLQAARLVTTSEGDEESRVAEGTIKKITGGEPITARFLYGQEFEYFPQFKVVWATNHKPVIIGTDKGIWRRIRLIPFLYTWPQAERKPLEEAKRDLLAQAEGILAWMVEGYVDYRKENLIQDPPKPIVDAVREYRDEMNLLGEFIDSSCESGPTFSIAVGELYGAYSAWAKANNEPKPLTKIKFGNRLRDLGYDQKQVTDGRRYWIGVHLKDGTGTLPTDHGGEDADAAPPTDQASRMTRIVDLIRARKQVTESGFVRGAPYELVVEEAVKLGIPEKTVRVNLDILTERGIIHTPMLGFLLVNE